MKIIERKITVAELTKNYSDDGDDGVFGYDGKLTIRPSFQRDFVYKDSQRDAVIETVFKGFPLNIMYWSKTGEDSYEVLDGQQRTISISQYVNKDFSIKINGDDKFYHNLTESEKKKIDDYELTIYICDGTTEEKLEWFKVINIAGETLTNQELLNSTYTGTWLADAKKYFSKRNCAACGISDGYVKGNPIRQEYLEKVLSWLADRDGLESGQKYMALHQHDEDANDMWLYFQNVINWAKMMFPKKRKNITDSQNWGFLYNKFHNKQYNTNKLEKEIQNYILDDDITKKSGIIYYILSERTRYDEKHLSLRSFTEKQKLEAYERQNHMCPCCLKEDNKTQYKFEDMQGDHIIPWSQGGRTVDDNLQMLCKRCNNNKSNK